MITAMPAGAASVQPAQWICTEYDETNGVPTGEANAVLQTSDGYIWIGGYGGLIRYDGHHFRNYSIEENGLPSSSIRALHEGSDGRLYIGTNDIGVYVYENGLFSAVEYTQGDDAFYSVRSFTELGDGTVLAGTTSGAARIEDREGLTLDAVEETMGQTIYDLACDTEGMAWGCSDNGRLFLIAEDGSCSVLESSELMEQDCYSVCAAADGAMYLGSSGSEVVRLDRTGETYEADAFEAEAIQTGELHTVNNMFESSDGTLWVLAANGIGCVEPDSGFRIPEETAHVQSAGCMIEDYEGNLWAASSKTGAVCFSAGKYYNFNAVSGLEHAAVNAVLWHDGFCYVGSDHGLSVLDSECRPVQNVLAEQLQSQRVRHIAQSSDGLLWFSLYGGGLVRYEPQTEEIRTFTVQDGLRSDQVRMSLELQDGTVAVAGSSGIDILDGETVVRSYGEDELPYPFILCMFQAKDGTLYAGSDGMGIYTISGDEVKQYYKEEGLEAGVIMRMAPDEELDGIWFAAGSTLYFWDDTGIRRLPLHTGIGSILDIQIVGDQLWLQKSSGPLIVNRTEVLAQKEGAEQPLRRTLSREYGLTGTLAANAWHYLDEQGQLWLCTNNGISVIDTKDMPVNDTPPKGAVLQLQADDLTYEQPDEVSIPAGTRRMTVHIAALSYTPAEKQVEYWLEGFEEEMTRQPLGDVSRISYTNLPGGDYVFHLTVYNEDGVQGESCSVAIQKEYQIWEHGIFWAGVFVSSLAAVILLTRLFYRRKMRIYKARQQEYRSIIEQSLQTFANAIDAKDRETNGHSVRVAAYARELARRMKLNEEDQEKIYYMALLHDIGKIGIPDSILKKEGKLTQEEWQVVRSHPAIGGEILKEFTAIEGIADGARYHHEFYNGKGYCEGLSGEAIPLHARIIAVADAFDAMCSKRYYHEENTIEYAREEIRRCSGSQFDPRAAACMVELIDDGFVGRGTGSTSDAEKTKSQTKE